MSAAQHRLSDFLQYELYHSIGSYRVSAEKLMALQARLAKAGDVAANVSETGARIPAGPSRHTASGDPTPKSPLYRLIDQTRSYNVRLHERRHATDWSTKQGHEPLVRHPTPTRLPLTKGDRFTLPLSDPEQAPANPWIRPEACAWIRDFYTASTSVLGRQWNDSPAPGATDWRPYCFRQSLITWRNGSNNQLGEPERTGLRLHRYRHRLEEARELLADGAPAGWIDPETTPEGSEHADRLVDRIAQDNLGTGTGSLSLFVIEALVEAHLGMHAVESCQSASLGRYAELAKALCAGEWLDRELDRCIALDTFVYCAGRTAPWLFAEDDAEGRAVFEDAARAWQNVKPTRCIWIATQLSLLALHRRAYARMLKQSRADKVGAYNDFHKLQGLIRDAERRVQRAPIHVEGAFEFLAGLDAQAHYHTGELYRGEHAQRPARKHFQAATHRLEQLRDAKNTTAAMQEVLTDSRWRVDLQVAHGKASYELGRHKESLCWHLRGWRAFLELLAADTETEASTGEITTAIAWLEKVRYEPELRKAEVERDLTPVVEQLERIAVNRRLGGLAADILLRLGHLLFTLNIGKNVQTTGSDPDADARERVERTLAFSCLRKALECDRHNTLVGGDMLKVRARFRERALSGELGGQPGGDLPTEYERVLTPPTLAPVGDQWPGSGDDYESLARVAEYLVLEAHVHADEPASLGPDTKQDYEVARHLLLNFFMHTDSINVRKSQVHRFLMRSADDGTPPCGKGEPAIEFVCMRRYSSAFPLLPRPSAFRALGGGYFVRLHRDRKSDAREGAYGIVVDPGMDYVENLYRAGFSLSDVRMVIVTHDHVDHLGSLDPLLSLLHTRSEIMSSQLGGDSPPSIPVIASESVMARYEQVLKLEPDKRFHQLSELVSDGGLLARFDDFPDGFGISAMSSKEIDDTGHEDLSEKPAYGIHIHGPRGISLTITSDTPTPPAPEDMAGRKRWLKAWRSALEADVLVSHLSSVPLTELRQLAQLDAGTGTLRADELRRWNERGGQLGDTIVRINGPLLERLDPDAKVLLGRLTASASALVKALGASATMDGLERVVRKVEEDANALRSQLPSDEPEHRTLTQFALEALAFAIEIRRAPSDPLELERIRARLERSNPNLQARLEFAMWLRSRGDRPVADLVGRVPDGWESQQPHAFLQGALRWAREYRRVRGEHRPGLFVMGELSEELGSMRGKVAARLNDTVLERTDGAKPGVATGDERFYALTSDIGLQLFVVPNPSSSAPNATAVKVLCTNCSLDTDRATAERYHPMHTLREVCVKGENEGIFYNCTEHYPSARKDEIFLEQLERFDVFGH